MATIETVRGPVDVSELGPTLAHEHIVILDPEALENYHTVWGTYWDEDAVVSDAIEQLGALRETGITTIFDPTVPRLGRNIRRIQRINAEVDINIVVATGAYVFLELSGFLAYRSDDQITELFVREIREGIDDTGVKAAFLKCCVEHHGLVGDIPRVLACVAAASLETGAPIMVHTNAPAKTGLLALDALTKAGVAPQKIVIAHMGDSNDLEYLRGVADAGAWLGLDRFNIPHFNPDENRIETLLALLEAGYVGQIHLGHDAAVFMDFFHANPPFANERPSYLHIGDRILPVLRERGVTREQIDTMLVDNPARFFS
jgi:phosphotriesterase-related protein